MCQESKNNIYNKSVYNKDKKSVIDSEWKVYFPSFNIIDNFPVPRLWTWEFKKSLWYIYDIIQALKTQNTGDIIILTHTRFFLSSLMGGYIARKFKLKWVHLEHGSDYVKLSSPFKNKISYLYDRIIGKWIFKHADQVLAISKASKKFIVQEFWREDVEVWYRGIKFPVIQKSFILQDMFPNKKIIWYIGRLYTWKNVWWLCEAYISLPESTKSITQLLIVWSWEDYEYLLSRYASQWVYFTGGAEYKKSLEHQSEFDIHVHPSAPWGWLATTLLQAMHLWCYIVASPYEWANEVLVDGENGILLKNASVEELRRWIIKALNEYEKKDIFSEKNTKILEERFDMKRNIEKLYTMI